MRSALFVFLVGVMVSWGATEAAEPAAAADRGGDEGAILKSITSYVEAYNRGDAKAVAAHWSDTGEWQSPSGERRVGKVAIEAGLQALFAERAGVTIEVLPPSVRFPSKGVAVERGTVVVRAPGEGAERSTYVALHVKQGGEWKLDSVYETAETIEAVASTPLHELEWLVGEWTDTAPEASIGASVFWMKNKSFLNYSFRVEAPGAEELEGTQVVGWDPVSGSIRSWMFDSDGGRGEGIWTKSGQSWVVKLQQTLPDGRRAASTNVYTLVDDDTILWKSIGRKIESEFLPNIEDVTLVRKRAIAEQEVDAEPAAVPVKK